jgi:hypothetical protein
MIIPLSVIGLKVCMVYKLLNTEGGLRAASSTMVWYIRCHYLLVFCHCIHNSQSVTIASNQAPPPPRAIIKRGKN